MVDRRSSVTAVCLAAAVSAACTPEILDPVDTGAGPGDGGSDSIYTRKTLAGELTWHITFDAEARATGATDCAYTRRYLGVEDGSRPWQCPTCAARFRAEVDVVAGLEGCYAQASHREPRAEEWLGYGGGPWWRGVGALMNEQGTATLHDDALTVVNDVADVEAPDGGHLAFHVEGTLTLGEERGDPLHGYRPAETYACGWQRAAPPAYHGDYTLAVGRMLPDGVFEDACRESVRLHDLAGAYLVVQMAAVDCPPCRQMAALEQEFVAGMAEQGIEVRVVTLLAPSLDDTLGETTTEMLVGWTQSFGLTAPVFADRGWGLSLFAPAIGDRTGFPSWAIVDPDLTVLEIDTGFDGWSHIGDVIRADRKEP